MAPSLESLGITRTPNALPANEGTFPADRAELAFRGGGLPLNPTPVATNSPPPVVPDAAASNDYRPIGQGGIIDRLKGFGENARSGPLGQAISDNSEMLLGIGAGLSTPSGGVMGPNMGAVAQGISGGMAADEQRAQQQASDQALTALFQSPQFAALSQEYRDVLAANPDLARELAIQQMGQSLAPQGDSVRPMNTEERAAWGIAADDTRPWGMDTTTGEPMIIGASGQTFNLGDQVDERPAVGTPTAGRQLVLDEETNRWTSEEIEGDVAEQKRLNDERAAVVDRASRIRNAGVVLRSIAGAAQLVSDNEKLIGIWSIPLQAINLPEAEGLLAYIDNIEGIIAVDTLLALKAAAGNGASGFGALSESELDLLKHMLGTLSTSTDPQQFIDTINDIYLVYSNIIEILQAEDVVPPGGDNNIIELVPN